MYSEKLLNSLFLSMIDYFSGDPKRIQHFTKVHSFARLIAKLENTDEDSLFVIESAAYVHDIGIKNSELKYGSCSGKNQEKEGPPEAEKLMSELGFSSDVIEKVSYLVSRHHTYSDIDRIELQILIEADFLVNLYEEKSDIKAVKSALTKIFKTNSGCILCRNIFGI